MLCSFAFFHVPATSKVAPCDKKQNASPCLHLTAILQSVNNCITVIYGAMLCSFAFFHIPATSKVAPCDKKQNASLINSRTINQQFKSALIDL
ncbi:MAG: hypothetical protein IJW13_06245 [Clostridia bacterium]|nr:hypothetical protein [Clostridia bacterium]